MGVVTWQPSMGDVAQDDHGNMQTDSNNARTFSVYSDCFLAPGYLGKIRFPLFQRTTRGGRGGGGGGGNGSARGEQ